MKLQDTRLHQGRLTARLDSYGTPAPRGGADTGEMYFERRGAAGWRLLRLRMRLEMEMTVRLDDLETRRRIRSEIELERTR